MIIGNIKDAERYFKLNKNFEKAFSFLQTLSKKSQVGPFETEGFRGNVMLTETSDSAPDASPKKLEAHRDYLDIHYVIEGSEAIGYAHIDTLSPVTEYDSAEDYLLLEGEMCKTVLNKGDFCIVFPEDAHAPAMCIGDSNALMKAVVKIADNA